VCTLQATTIIQNEASFYGIQICDTVWFDNNQRYEGTMTMADSYETVVPIYHTTRNTSHTLVSIANTLRTWTLTSNQNFPTSAAHDEDRADSPA